MGAFAVAFTLEETSVFDGDWISQMSHVLSEKSVELSQLTLQVVKVRMWVTPGSPSVVG